MMWVGNVSRGLVLGALFILALETFASEKKDADTTKKETIETLQKLFPGLKVLEVNATPSDSLEEIVFEGGQSVYLVKGSNLILKGELISVNNGGLVNLTEENNKKKRKAALDAVDTNDMIVFSPKNETKAVLTVFTDTDCGYCRKLHQEVPELNEKGVEVRYLAFPRGGVASSTYMDLSSAWCSDNKREALNQLKARKRIPKKECKANPVAAQYGLGNAVGVTATPATILPDGQLVMGYRTASDWLKVLGL